MFVADFRKNRVKITNKFEFLKVVGHNMNIFEENAIKSVLSKFAPMVLSFMPLFSAFKAKPPQIRTHVCSAKITNLNSNILS